jgi:tetratricopeptide (TPR) repeat protein
MGRRKWVVLGLIIAVVTAFFYIIQSIPSSVSIVNQAKIDNAYVGDEQCKSCHYKQWQDWKVSDHYKAMLPANDSTVKGNFNNATYTKDGITSKFFKKRDQFYINTQGPDGRNHDYKVAYTFGHYPLQQYLIEFPGGRMQATRMSWNSKENKWFHQYKGQAIAASDWLHWTRDAQNWNTMCARCHSTNLQKNYDFESDTYHTTYSVRNVSCESCHGAGKLHIDFVNSKEHKGGKKVLGSYLFAGKPQQASQINTCSPCHMRGAEILNTSEISDEIMDHFIPEIPSSEFFYADGQVKEEDYTYTSFLQSKMYSKGVMCSNCHNVHSGKTLYVGNQLCLQCHAKKYDDVAHTFHIANTEASQCVSCHMPGTYYMGNDFRHDHAFRIPRPDLSEKYGTPNACNKCHTNQSASWAAGAVRNWYGSNRVYHFSEDLILASKEDKNSEAHIVRLINDTATPAIVKATALYYLKNISTQTALQLLLKELSNSDAQVRYRALRNLGNFSPDTWLAPVLPLLTDKVRAVRIAAADLLITVPSQNIPIQYSNAFSSAKSELEKYVLYQTDFADGSVMAGDYYMKQQDYVNAEKFYVRALKKDSLLNYARLNLSAVYNAQAKNNEALNILKTAAAVTPTNERVFYNLGLLYVEMKDTAAAIKAFEKGASLRSTNPRLYYNYGLLLFFKSQRRKAEDMLKRGLKLSPNDDDIKHAITYLNTH